MPTDAETETLALVLDNIRRHERAASKRRLLWLTLPLVFGVGALMLFLIQEANARKHAEQNAAEALKDAKVAQHEKEKAEQANAQLNAIIQGLKAGNGQLPSAAKAVVSCVDYAQKGNELRKTGDLSGAEQSYDQAAACQRDLAKSTNDNTLRFQLSSTLTTLGSIRLAKNDVQGALSAYEESLQIRSDLASLPGADERWKVGKFYSLLYASDAARILDNSKSVSLAKQALLLAQTMATDNNDPEWAKAVSVAKEQVRRVESGR